MESDSLHPMIADRLAASLQPIVQAWLAGTASMPITVLKLSMALDTVDETRALLDDVIATIKATSPAGSAPRERAAAMETFLDQHRSGVSQVKAFLEFEKQHHESGSPDPVGRWAALFDAWARESEGASVALYSFGDESLLDALTGEVVALLDRWNLLGSDR